MKSVYKNILRLSVSALFVVSTMLFAGCASNKKEQAIMQSQITQIDERVASIDERVASIDKNMQLQADLMANMEQLQRSVLTVTGQIEEFNMRAQMLSQRMQKLERSFSEMSRVYRSEVLERSAETNMKLEKLEKQVNDFSVETRAFIRLMEKKSGISEKRHRKTATALSLKQAEPPVKQNGAVENIIVDPDDLYQRSYNSYLKGDYDSSIKGFSNYVKRYPETNLSDNAAYWIAESYYNKKDPVNAAKAFDEMAERYPTSNKAPTALLKSAHVLLDINSREKAIERLRKIVNDYSISSEAITATDMLSSLGEKN